MADFSAPLGILLHGEEHAVESGLDPEPKPTGQTPNRTQYLIHWWGRGTEENEWWFDSKLSNAADAVQVSTPAARVGQPDEMAGVPSVAQTVRSACCSNKQPAVPIIEPATQSAPKCGLGLIVLTLFFITIEWFGHATKTFMQM